MTEIITEEMADVKSMISATVAKREALKAEMQEWFERFPDERFAKMKDLIATDSVLSQLDSHYKQLWDFHNSRDYSA